MRLVIIESPYAGDTERNTAYARAAMADCLARGEAPIASHLLYTQPGVLNDNEPDERKLGIDAGLAWGRVADAAVFYTDLGWSRGMREALAWERARGMPVEFRTLTGWALPEVSCCETCFGPYPATLKGCPACNPAGLSAAHGQFRMRAANDAPTDAELIAEAWGMEGAA